MFVIFKSMSNFVFLKKNNENFFNIISEAEKLFRDEYFEQTIVQTRRFAENICKDLLQGKVLPEETFDSMINRIKDQSFGNMRMQEFTEDLYFMKKHGNNSAHSAVAAKNGKIALECLERAYEIAIFYECVKYGYNKKLDKTVFSEELLMTGKKSSPKVLKEIYSDELKRTRAKASSAKPKKIQKNQKTGRKPASKVRNKKKKKIFPILFTISLILAVVVALFLSFNNNPDLFSHFF